MRVRDTFDRRTITVASNTLHACTRAANLSFPYLSMSLICKYSRCGGDGGGVVIWGKKRESLKEEGKKGGCICKTLSIIRDLVVAQT